jgi:hypothetical protein
MVDYAYLDTIKLAGHSCPTVASAYWMTCKALKALYAEQVPERGKIRVEFRRSATDGVCGVMANVIGLLTGRAQHCLQGHRRPLRPQRPAAVRMRHSGRRAIYPPGYHAGHPCLVEPASRGIIPPDWGTAACLNGTASTNQQIEFGRAWQARVKALLLDHADDPAVFQLRME